MNLILVDTSVWIDWLRTRPHKRFLDAELAKIAICPPIIQEILQGLTSSKEAAGFRERLLQLPCLGDPMDLDLYTSAAELYSRGRSKGFTVRSSIDCLIAAVAIRHRVPVMHRDRDFKILSQISSLELVTSLI